MFDRFLDELPNLQRLMASGTWGPLRSVDPPITVPAWSCMTSGRDPGELGIYGFRNRSGIRLRLTGGRRLELGAGRRASGITSRTPAST